MSYQECILASASPRRHEILSWLGIEHTVIPSKAEEPRITNVENLIQVSEFKAKDVYAQQLVIASEAKPSTTGWLILAADTIVYTSATRILGKPRDAAEAASMLEELSGNKHQVSTAITLMQPDGTMRSAVETTVIYFRQLSRKEIQNYIAEYKPYDKAGAYAIQEPASLFIERIEGCYSNVVGLPVALLLKTLEQYYSTR